MTLLILESGNVEDILSAISTYDNAGSNRQALSKELLTLVKGKNIKFKLTETPILNSIGAYHPNENLIEIDSNRIKDKKDKQLANLILHEIVHAVTRNAVEEFVNFDGTYKVGKSEVPKSLQNIVEMYSYAKNKIEEEVGMKASELTFDYLKERDFKFAPDDPKLKLYAVKDIHEFLTHTIAEIGSKQEMFKEMKYENKNFIEKLLDYYKQFLKEIFGENTGNIAAQTTMETLKFLKDFKPLTGSSYNSNASISSTLDVMDSKYGPIVSKPSVEELSISDKNTTFNNPFTGKCKL